MAGPVEQCAECGFDGAAWEDPETLRAIGALPDRWESDLGGLAEEDLIRRPLAGTWSIAEYADHVREVLFAMRFVLDSLSSAPGVDLGPSPAPGFAPEPRLIDVAAVLFGLREEARALTRGLEAIPDAQWDDQAVLDGTAVDVHWVARHAVHDGTHHLLDVHRLREAL